ncbi:MAG: hypothetical protein K0R03_1580 [Moraxellaceae bacterium]|nr:hypothetical protein [Moraxellaceae bacterium]
MVLAARTTSQILLHMAVKMHGDWERTRGQAGTASEAAG